MKSKEPGAIRQLFMFVGSSKGKMKFSILMAVLGELFGMVPFLILAMLADSLYSGTATTKDTVILARHFASALRHSLHGGRPFCPTVFPLLFYKIYVKKLPIKWRRFPWASCWKPLPAFLKT